MIRVSWLALALAVVVTTPDVGAAQAKHQWKFVSIIPAGQVFTKVFQELAEDLTRKSDGRLQVTLYPAGELPYKGTEYLRTAGRGLVEMAEVVGGFTFGDAPQLVLPDLPYVALNEAEQQALVSTMLPVAEAALRAKGVEPIAWGVYPRRQIVMRDGRIMSDELVATRRAATEELGKLKAEQQTLQLTV